MVEFPHQPTLKGEALCSDVKYLRRENELKRNNSVTEVMRLILQMNDLIYTVVYAVNSSKMKHVLSHKCHCG